MNTGETNMIILTILSVAGLAGGAYLIEQINQERINRAKRADLIRRGYIL